MTWYSGRSVEGSDEVRNETGNGRKRGTSEGSKRENNVAYLNASQLLVLTDIWRLHFLEVKLTTKTINHFAMIRLIKISGLISTGCWPHSAFVVLHSTDGSDAVGYRHESVFRMVVPAVCFAENNIFVDWSCCSRTRAVDEALVHAYSHCYLTDHLTVCFQYSIL